jgi:D-xylose transport system substrate-binding protein
MTVYKSVDKEASAAAKLAVALAKGEDITDPKAPIQVTETVNDGRKEIPYYPLEPIAVTKENLDEVIIDGGFHQKEDVYLNID